MIYLDNSATSFPKPKEVYDSYKNAIKYYHSNPGRGGYENSIATADKIYEIREKTAAFFGEKNAENVIFTANCTTAINMVLKGLLKPGDHVLISDLEHNAVVRVIEYLKRYSSIEYDIFETDFYDDAKTLKSLRKSLKAQTKLVFCTHASNVLGVCLPIEQIGSFCKQNNLYFAVDGAQSGGILPLDMQRQHIDFLCLAPHKGLFAPMGTGLLIGDGSKLDTILQGGTGSQSLNLSQPSFLPDKLESGTANVCGIIAMGAGIDFIEKHGRERIYQTDFSHISAFWKALNEIPEMDTYYRLDVARQCAPVFSFNVHGIESEVVADMLANKGICVRAGFHCAPLAHKKIGTTQGGTVRISPSFFTNVNEINYTISTIKNLLLNF